MTRLVYDSIVQMIELTNILRRELVSVVFSFAGCRPFPRDATLDRNVRATCIIPIHCNILKRNTMKIVSVSIVAS